MVFNLKPNFANEIAQVSINGIIAEVDFGARTLPIAELTGTWLPISWPFVAGT